MEETTKRKEELESDEGKEEDTLLKLARVSQTLPMA